MTDLSRLSFIKCLLQSPCRMSGMKNYYQVNKANLMYTTETFPKQEYHVVKAEMAETDEHDRGEVMTDRLKKKRLRFKA